METREDPTVTTRPHGTDHGMTMVEILVSVVLIGTVLAATLGAMRISILGGTVHRDHANAHAWLQSASDVLYARTKVDCSSTDPDGGKAAILALYQPTVDVVANPETWTNAQIRIVDVQFWNATDTDHDGVVEYRFGVICQDTINLALQRITLEVRSPNGRIIDQVELIK